MNYKEEYNRVCDQLKLASCRVNKTDEFIAFVSFSDGTYSYNSYSSRLDWVQDVKNNYVSWSILHCSQDGVLKGKKHKTAIIELL